MNIYLCGLSALEFWRRAGVIESRTSTRGRSRRMDNFHSNDPNAACNVLKRTATQPSQPFALQTNQDSAVACAKQWKLTLPLHVFAGNAQQYRSTPFFLAHMLTDAWQKAAYLPLQDGIWVAAPVTCIMQMAALLDSYQLAQLACEFCGMYVSDAKSESGVGRRHPLCSAAELGRAVYSSPSFKGIKRLRAVAAYVLDNAASFRETSLTLALTLPRSMGGFHLPKPLLNKEVKLPRKLARIFKRASVTCDLVYPKVKLVIEYKGRYAHDNEYAWENDPEREAILKRMAYEVLSITNGQVRTRERLLVTAQTVAAKLGIRLQFRSKSWPSKFGRAHAALFGSGR